MKLQLQLAVSLLGAGRVPLQLFAAAVSCWVAGILIRFSRMLAVAGQRLFLHAVVKPAFAIVELFAQAIVNIICFVICCSCNCRNLILLHRGLHLLEDIIALQQDRVNNYMFWYSWQCSKVM